MNNKDLKKYGNDTLFYFFLIEVLAWVFGYYYGCSTSIFYIITGFFISVGLGTPVVGRIQKFFAKDIEENYREKVEDELHKSGIIIPELDASCPRCHLQWLLGLSERFLFTSFFAISPQNAIVAAGGWIAIKLAASWRRREEKDHPYAQLLIRELTLTALLCSLISLSFAFVGGIVLRFGIELLNNDPTIGFWSYILVLIKIPIPKY